MNKTKFFSSADFLLAAAEVSLTPTGASVEVASAIQGRFTPLSASVLLDSPKQSELATLRGLGLEVIESANFAVISMPATEIAKRTAKKEKSLATTAKDLANSSRLNYLTDRSSMNVVKKLFQQYVGAEEDFSMYTSFYRDMDKLISEYRTLCGIDDQPEELEDDEDETDDYDEDQTVAAIEKWGETASTKNTEAGEVEEVEEALVEESPKDANEILAAMEKSVDSNPKQNPFHDTVDYAVLS